MKVTKTDIKTLIDLNDNLINYCHFETKGIVKECIIASLSANAIILSKYRKETRPMKKTATKKPVKKVTKTSKKK